MREIIRFTTEEWNKIEAFAEHMKWKHPHFKDKRNTTKRSPDQIKQDVILGKLAEVAVYKYLKSHYNSDVSELDFNVYGEGVADEYDVKVRGKVISIKSSKMGSSCLLIEKAKFQVDQEGQLITLEHKPLPDFFMFVRINIWDIKNVYAEISGSISMNGFWNEKRFLPRGFLMNKDNARNFLLHHHDLSTLDTTTKGIKMLADNYGVHVDTLYELTSIFPPHTNQSFSNETPTKNFSI